MIASPPPTPLPLSPSLHLVREPGKGGSEKREDGKRKKKRRKGGWKRRSEVRERAKKREVGKGIRKYEEEGGDTGKGQRARKREEEKKTKK